MSSQTGNPTAAWRHADTIAAAFADNPMVCWLLADLDPQVDRHRLLTEYFQIFTDHAGTHGQVDTTSDELGVALWLHPNSGAPADYDQRLAEITGSYHDRFAVLDRCMNTAHPDQPCAHLAFLAVHPRAQSRGYGSMLLQTRHQVLDDSGWPAYLEASAARNRALYQRMGWRLLDDAVFSMPGGGPSMWPMWRDPA